MNRLISRTIWLLPESRSYLASYTPSFARTRTFHHSAPVHSKDVSSSDEPPNLEIPEPVPYVNRTTPLMTQEETERYFYPLSRRGWKIQKMGVDDGFNVADKDSPFLIGTMTLKGPKSARTLLKQLLAFEEQEKHDVSFNLWSGKRPTLTIISQTHSARKNAEQQTDETAPNVTLRDVRFAVLLETFAKEAGVVYSPKKETSPDKTV
ncbi:hypothetical protein D9613_000169 [Agrocybe pediades]|uniref:Uncharacterized protein n=1 Tax=Agrocybe pediades TaxID=84607 RepID=A0A8H4R269_9AGAR|nr:hypothetical protein D9613_000169 [Agrocybe pediades]